MGQGAPTPVTSLECSRSEGPATNIVWKQAIPGKGWSSPVFYDGRVYLTSAVRGGDGSRLSLRALCVNAGDGRILWNAEVFSHENLPRIHEKNSHASPTPLVEGNRLYVHFGRDGVACLDLGGSIVWRNTSLVYEPVHAAAVRRLVDEKLIKGARRQRSIRRCAGQDHRQGSMEDQARIGCEEEILVQHAAADRCAGTKTSHQSRQPAVCAYDPATGREIWRVRHDGYS
jgi:outer membrane protein assembly factor BamB